MPCLFYKKSNFILLTRLISLITHSRGPFSLHHLYEIEDITDDILEMPLAFLSQSNRNLEL